MTSPNLAVVAHGKDDVRIDAVAEPDPTPDQAVLAIAYGGICGSDLHYWTHGAAGQSVLRDPMILGHEVVGTVLEAAADGTGPAAGTPVAVHPGTAIDDGRTPWPRDRTNLSPAGTYLGSAAHRPHTQGAFAQRVALPTRMLRALPDGLDVRTAAVAEPASVAWHGVGLAGDVQGRTALVVGAGPIGLLAVAALRHHGAGRIIVADLVERPLTVARELGANETLDARDSDALAALAADVVIEASGSVPGLASALSASVRGGIVVMVGLQRSGDVPVPMATAISRELTLRGSFRFDQEIDPVIAALADHSLTVDPVISHEVPLENAVDGFRLALDASRSSKVLLTF